MAYRLTKEALEEILGYLEGSAGRDALREEVERRALVGGGQLSFDPATNQYPNVNSFYAGILSKVFPDWTVPVDLTSHWTEAGLTKPVDYTSILVQSRRSFQNGNVQCFVQLNDLSSLPGPPWPINHFCSFERGAGVRLGIASWVQVSGQVRAEVYSNVGGVELNLTPLMPADIYTEEYLYCVKVNRNNVEFYLGAPGYATRLRAVVVTAPISAAYILITEPYAIAVAPCQDFTTMMNVLLESSYSSDHGKTVALTLPLSPRWLRASDGNPCPPRVYRLYEEETDTLLAGKTVDPDVTSHPFPLFGYEGKTINFMSDEAGNIDIEVLKSTGNWRVHSTVAIAANTLVTTTITDEEVLGRIVFTPTLPPANILEAEVVLR